MRSIPVVLLVLVGARAALAQDAPPAPPPAPPAPPAMEAAPAPAPPAPAATSAERARAVRAALPAPSAERAFAFEADLWLGQGRFGNATFQVGVSGPKERPRWEVHERSTTSGGPRTQVHETTAILDRALHVLAYDRTSRVEGGASTRTEIGFAETGEMRVTRTDEDGEATTTTPEGGLEATATLAALLVFLRGCPPEPAAYELPVFVQDSATVETGRIDVKGAAPLAFRTLRRDAWTATFAVGKFTFEVFLDGKDRAPLAIRIPEAGILFLATSLGVVEDAEPLSTDGPATTPRDCGARFALGLRTGDLSLVEAAIDWPSMHEGAKARGETTEELEGFRRAVLSAFQRALQSGGRPATDAVVRGAAEAATEEKDGDDVVVGFGAPFERLRYRARAFDGAWRIVELLPPKR